MSSRRQTSSGGATASRTSTAHRLHARAPAERWIMAEWTTGDTLDTAACPQTRRTRWLARSANFITRASRRRRKTGRRMGSALTVLRTLADVDAVEHRPGRALFGVPVAPNHPSLRPPLPLLQYVVSRQLAARSNDSRDCTRLPAVVLLSMLCEYLRLSLSSFDRALRSNLRGGAYPPPARIDGASTPRLGTPAGGMRRASALGLPTDSSEEALLGGGAHGSRARYWGVV